MGRCIRLCASRYHFRLKQLSAEQQLRSKQYMIVHTQQKPSGVCHRMSAETSFVLFYRQRSGRIRVLSFKIGIILMCKAALEDKYRCESPEPQYFSKPLNALSVVKLNGQK